MKTFPLLSLAAILALSATSRAATLQLNLVSEPGDRTDQGFTLSLRYDTEQGSIAGSSAYGLLAGSPDTLYFTADHALSGPPDTYTTIQFTTARLNIPIQTGIYTDAERAPFASEGHPGLDFSFQHGGANELTGSFTITELTFDAAHEVIQTFEGSFIQYSEHRSSAMRGQIRYDLNPVTAPEPGTAGLATLAAVFVFGTTSRPLNRRRQLPAPSAQES